MAKSLFLLLKANNHAKIVSAEIKDGCVIIEGKQFIVDTSSPILIEKRFGSVKPLYILKWSSTVPSTNIHSKGLIQEVSDSKLEAERVQTSFDDKYNMTPEMLRKIMGMKILGNMIKVPEKKVPKWLFFVLFGVVAFLIIYVLYYTGTIRF